MVSQPARRAHNDGRTRFQHAAFLRRVHAANTCRNARTRLLIQPCKLSANLQGQFARRRNHQSAGRIGRIDAAILAQNLRRKCKPECDCLARSCLRRNYQIAAMRLRFQNGGLYRRWRVISALGKGFGKAGGQIGKSHGNSAFGEQGIGTGSAAQKVSII